MHVLRELFILQNVTEMTVNNFEFYNFVNVLFCQCLQS